MTRHVFCKNVFHRLKSHHLKIGLRYMSKVNHYAVLKVSTNASLKEIKKAYIELSKQYHPDTNQNDNACHEEFVKIKESYDVLISLHRRIDTNRKVKNPQNVYRQNKHNSHKETKHSSRKEADFSQFKEEHDNVERLIEIILILWIFGITIFIANIIGSVIRTVKKKQDAKYPKSPRKISNIDDEIEKIMKKDRDQWDDMDKYLANIYIELYYKKD